jgi:hypothetical protein
LDSLTTAFLLHGTELQQEHGSGKTSDYVMMPSFCLQGFRKNQWQINYSYDLVVSGLWGHTGGTSEISLVFLLKKPGRESHMPFFNFFDEEHGFQ